MRRRPIRSASHLIPFLILPCLLASGLLRPDGGSRAASASLSVRSVSPAADAAEVAPVGRIVIQFDRPVVALVGVGEQAPPSPLVASPPLPSSGHWLTSSIYIHDAVLRAATTYNLRISAGLRALDGTRLAQTYAWHFATQRPAVLTVTPDDGFQYALPSAAPSASFSGRVDHPSAEAAFHLRDSQDRAVSGHFSWSGDTILTFHPAAALLRTATYTASIDAGVRSAEGPLPSTRATSWRFTVAPYLRLLTSIPQEGGVLDLASQNYLEIDFNAPLDLKSAIAHLHFTPDLANRYVSLGQNSISLQINGAYAPSTAYTVRLDAGLRSAAGDPLLAPYTLHFRTAAVRPSLSFVTGSVASYDAYRPINLSLQAVNPGPLSISLFRLDQATFVAGLAKQSTQADDLPSSTQILTATVQPATVLDRATPLSIPLSLGRNRPLVPGYYLVRIAGMGDASDGQLLVVTRTNLTLKVAQRQVLVWATDLRSGAPVARMPLTVLGTNANGSIPPRPLPQASGLPTAPSGSSLVGSGRTGVDGLLRLDVPGVPAERSLVDMGLLALSGPNQVAAVGAGWSGGISPYDYGLSAASYQPARRLTLYTDRPIYRPDQIVQLRGVVRADDDGRYSLVNDPVYLTLTDPQGKTLIRRTLGLDRFGSFATGLPLAVGASLGNYGINVTSGPDGTSSNVQVAEYRKPTYAVSVSPQRPTYTKGETIEADVHVTYYFSGPVPNAKVHWSLLGYDYLFYSQAYGDFSFASYDPAAIGNTAGPASSIGALAPPRPGFGGYALYQGDAVTDAGGVLHLKLAARLPKDRTAQGYTLEANVTDLDNNPVAGSNAVTVYSSAVQIGLQTSVQVPQAGVAQTIRAITLLNDGNTPAAGQVLAVSIYRRTYKNVIKAYPDGSVDQQSVPVDTLLRTLSLRTDAHGKGGFAFIAPSAGEYRIAARGSDRFGNPTSAELFLYAYAAGEAPVDWGYQPQGHIRLVADKRTYHTGDTAHILVAAPYPGMEALITIERGRILSSRVQRLVGNATTLDIPIPASYLPDTYVGVVVERGAAGGAPASWRMGYAHIHVDPQERAIRLSVRPSGPRVAPGAPLPLRIHATNATGRPVQAGLSLGVVDAAAVALAGDSGSGTGLLDTFYGTRPLGVFTADTLNVSPEQLLIRPKPQQSRAGNFAPNVDSVAPHAALAQRSTLQGAGGGGLSDAGIQVRSRFADTAYWNTAVDTDANGNATLSIPLPDNITTWQILGQGVTADTLAGAASATVIATKDLLLRPLLPRFLSLGDRAIVGATINNTTSTARTVRLTLSFASAGAFALQSAPTGTRTIRLAAGAEQDVTWPVTVSTLGAATMQVVAIDKAHAATNDAVRLTVPVRENSTPETVATSGDAGSRTQELVRVPAGIEPNEGSLTLTLEPTLAAGLRVGADYLRDYPYDSSIDLANRILGLAELGRFPTRAAVLTAPERAALRGTIARLLAKLYPMQRADGGFGWWSEDPNSSPYITVPVVEALTIARRHGYAMDTTILSRAVAYLITNGQSPAAVNAADNYDATLQAGIVYAVTMAGQGAQVATLAGQLFDVRPLLGHAAEAQLGAALYAQSPTGSVAQIRTILADLTGSAKPSATGNHWDEAQYDWRGLDSDISGTATILDALLILDSHNPLIPNTVRWLMSARKVNAWESTEATASSLQALVDYTIGSGELNGNYRYRVARNNTTWATGSVDAGNLAQPRILTQQLGPQAPAGSAQRLAIGRDVRPGNGNLHYTIALRYYRPVDHIAAVSEGVGVSRRYLVSGGAGGSLGAAIRVQLTVVAPQDLFYLTLEDPLPAGAEPVDGSLRTTSQLVGINGRSTIPKGTGDLGWYVTHTDLRDDRTALFIGFLPAGTYQYTYLIHLATRGSYHALPTHLQETYFPEVFGRSAGGYFGVR